MADFHQTVEYINSDTTDAQLYSFRASFSIKTLNKQADIIIDSVDNILDYPSKVPSLWSNYSQYVDMVIESGDTVVTSKYGTWGEFLNLQNLVVIEGSLYKITKEKTIMILDGDLDKLDDAEDLEESDTINGIFITPRACACDPTGWEWKYEQVTKKDYSGHKYDITSTETFSNMTIWRPENGRIRIYPKFEVKSKIHIRKKGITWFCHKMHFNWTRQVWIRHDLELPIPNPNYYSGLEWYHSTGWNNHYECDFNYTTTYSYNSYLTTRKWGQPVGYCLAVRIFSQTMTTVDNPIFSNNWYFYPFPSRDCMSLIDNECANFEWLYINE